MNSKQTTMKKFKNSLNVRGSQSLLKAFIEEIEKIGYLHNTSNDIPESIESVVTYNLGQYNLMNHIDNYYGSKNVQIIDLPQDWNKALELAKELEKQEPDLYTDEDLVYLDGKKEELFIGDNYYSVQKENFFTGLNRNLDKGQISIIKNGNWAIFKTEKAAQDYITLQKAIKESGLKVGNSLNNYYSYYQLSDDKFQDSAYFSENYKVVDFKIYKNLPCVIVDNIWKYAVPLKNIKSNKLTFGGNEVILNKKGNSVDITCKGVTGSYEELKEIFDSFVEYKTKFKGKFGSVEFKKFTINEEEYEPYYTNLSDEDTVTIGCTTAEVKELKNILKECEILLGK